MKVLQPFSLFLSLASAAVVKRNFTSHSTETCKTVFGSISLLDVSTITQSTTSLLTQTQTVFLTPTVTISPSAAQVLATATSTAIVTETAPQLTGTVTLTLSTILTSTVSSTSTVITTETRTSTFSTTVTGTSTIGTVSGFTPAASLPSVQRNGGGSVQKRHIAEPVKQGVSRRSNALLDSNGKCLQYPKEVSCTKTVEVISFTTTTITNSQVPITVTAGPLAPLTSTTTVTSTLTTLIVPVEAIETASITSTIITTSTIVSTVTETTTTTSSTTSTSFAAQATEYAACAANNLINTVGTTRLTNASLQPGGAGSTLTSATSPQACCNSCQAAADCAGFIYLSDGPTGTADLCIQIQAMQCAPSTVAFDVYNDQGSSTVNFGNGPCGQGVFQPPA